ncbi:MAG TPA: SurA N-terminal domain-containing protein, partial [Nitrospira sp.]|nr:SurA N-terminal domain-containing protein [Nitrospira sp.]
MTSPQTPDISPWRARLTGTALALCALGSLAGCTEPPQEEPVIAMINGRSITQAEFDIRWEELSQATRARYEKEGGKRRFLDELIMRELLMQEARKQG